LLATAQPYRDRGAQQDWGGAMAAAIFASLPAVAVFAFLQRFFIAGLTSGAVKS
jgi:multiple sugar transport system permease protein